MKHIYIFNTDSQAGDYGIGTYLRELKVCLRSEPEITLTFVELQSVEKEFSAAEMAENIQFGSLLFVKKTYKYRGRECISFKLFTA